MYKCTKHEAHTKKSKMDNETHTRNETYDDTPEKVEDDSDEISSEVWAGRVQDSTSLGTDGTPGSVLNS